ncbi:MAG: DUF3298 domain-containing protein [Bacteroidales bacterium]|nr:DUF3298 domain-containing protein [Bacteroidales bacterium]
MLRKIFAVGLAVLAAVACRPSGGKDLITETLNYEESAAHADLSMKVELPVSGQSAAADRIRATLVEVMDAQLSHIGSYEEDRLFPEYEGDRSKTEFLVTYYRDKALEAIGRLSQEDYDERVASIEENDGLTDGQRKEFIDQMSGWEYDFNLLKDRETDKCVVFISQDYVYLGGAHGGVIGRGGLTFDKKDGHLVEKMLDPACLDAIQPLLRKGLTQYFSDNDMEVTPEELDNYLFLETGVIPFPAWTPYPSEDGLVFTYQQYEIAAYAAGMPEFTIPFADLLPYLTPEAKALVGLE